MRHVWPVLMSFWFTTHTFAQDVLVATGDIVDTRTTSAEPFAGACEIELRAVGPAAATAKSIRSVRLNIAVDDTGRDLRNPTPGRSMPRVTRIGGDNYLTSRIQLINPARSASVIKHLEGELVLYHPTAENGGRIVLQEFQTHPGEFINSPDLKRAGIGLIFVTKDTEEVAQKRLGMETATPTSAESTDEASNMRRLMMRKSSAIPVSYKNPVRFLFNDPEGKLVELGFMDATGAPIPTQASSRGATFFNASFEKGLPSDAQLIVYLATTNSLTTVPFRLENIPLP